MARDNFHITRKKRLINCMLFLSHSSLRLLGHIIQNIDNNNLVSLTQKQLTDISGLGRRTIQGCYKELRDMDIIVTKRGMVMLNPLFMVRGSIKKENILIKRYSSFMQEL